MRSKFLVGLISTVLLITVVPTDAMATTDEEFLKFYGTSRRPVRCSPVVSSQPKTGRLSAAQATEILRCLREGEGRGVSDNMVEYLDVLSMKVGPPRKVSEADSLQPWTINLIDRRRPMYDIKARAVFYNCYPIQYDPQVQVNQPGKNCQSYGSTTSGSINSKGICFKDKAKNWSSSWSAAFALVPFSTETSRRSTAGPGDGLGVETPEPAPDVREALISSL
jgi:hypothetical protein